MGISVEEIVTIDVLFEHVGIHNGATEHFNEMHLDIILLEIWSPNELKSFSEQEVCWTGSVPVQIKTESGIKAEYSINVQEELRVTTTELDGP